MQKVNVGKLLKRFRMEKNISANELVEGVCTATAISNYEAENRSMDTLVFEFFLERMGISPENFAFMLTEKEYRYYVWKNDVHKTIYREEWDNLEHLLKQEVDLHGIGNKKIQRQFYNYCLAILEAQKNAQYKKAVKYLLDAINETVENIFEISDKCLLSTRELHILLLYVHYSRLAGIMEDFVVEKWLCDLEKYVLSSKLELSEMAKIYPKLVCIRIQHQRKFLSVQEQMRMCEKSIELLRESMQFDDILEIIKIYSALLDEKSEVYSFYKRQYEVFSEIIAYAGGVEKFRVDYIEKPTPKIYTITEYLKYRRNEEDKTQEYISEGICEPETYSRIENGRRSPSPSTRKELMSRLNVGWHFFRGELDTDSVEIYRLRNKQRIAEIREEWEESYNYLQEMKMLLDMNSRINMQYIISNERAALYHLGKISSVEYCESIKSLLNLTTGYDEVEKNEMAYYSQLELEMYGDIAKCYRKDGKINEALLLLESVLSRMEKSKVDFVYQWNGVGYIQRICANLHFSKGDYKESYRMRKMVYDMAVRRKDAGNLAIMLDGMADDLEHIGEQYKDEYMKLYRLTYYVADFYKLDRIRDYTKNYYVKFEPEYIWYG